MRLQRNRSYDWENVQGVDFIAINTDVQSLNVIKALTQLQIGTDYQRFGSGAIPDVGRAAAEEDRERIAELIQGSNMIFITAGMGEGQALARLQ